MRRCGGFRRRERSAQSQEKCWGLPCLTSAWRQTGATAERVSPATSARLLLWIQRAARRTKSSVAASELSGSALRLDSEGAEAPRLLLSLPPVKERASGAS